MKKYLKIEHLISKKINGVIIQIFYAIIAYLFTIEDSIFTGDIQNNF
ncbi:MAG: hypothetical protein QXZ12_08635 [Thermoplasmata archaeon]